MKNDIIETVIKVICKVADITPEEIKPEMSLDSPEIGLSSIDII